MAIKLQFTRTPSRKQLRLCCVLFFSFLFFPILARADLNSLSWKTLENGLQESLYMSKDTLGNPVRLRLYKVNLQLLDLKVFQANDFNQETISTKSLVKQTKGLLAINASFFDSGNQSLGLVIRDSKVLNSFKPISWWGVFKINTHRVATIEAARSFHLTTDLITAFQAGPRLVENGKALSVKSNFSRKSFLAISNNPSEIILGITESVPINIQNLAKILADELKVKSALNLDGGSSTQLYLNTPNNEHETKGYKEVANGLVVMKP